MKLVFYMLFVLSSNDWWRYFIKRVDVLLVFKILNYILASI